VFACQTDNLNNKLATHFRTYPFEQDYFPNCTIWEAGRATTAAPTFFEAISIDNRKYVDGALQINNPVMQAVTEGMVAFGKARRIGCVLSIGTGMSPNRSLRDNEGIGGNVRSIMNLGTSLLKMATNSELTHLKVEAMNKTKRLADQYFRFSAGIGIPSADEPDWEKTMIKLDDAGGMPKFKKMTEEYLRGAQVNEQILDCAKQLNALYYL
jgi:predicted acylesterase/phospholipase RssA